MTPRSLLFVFLAPLIVPAAAALPLGVSGPSLPALPGDPTPNAPEAIEADYSVLLRDDLSGFDVDIQLRVYEIDIGLAQSLPAQAVRDAPNRDLFEEAVERRIAAELARTFPGANVALDHIAYDYGAFEADDDPYRPPIRIHATAEVDFTAAYLGLPALGDVRAETAASAFLESGGVYRFRESLAVAPGVAVRLVIDVPDRLTIHAAHGPVDRLVAAYDNLANGTSRSMPVEFSVSLEPAHVSQSVWRGPLVRIGFDVEDHTSLLRQSVPFAPGRFDGRLDVRIEVTSLEGRFFENYPLPETLSLDHMSADVLRVAFQAGLVRSADVEAFFERLVTRGIQNAFGNQTVVEFDHAAFAHSAQAPIGGADGRTVAPLVVHATSAVPVKVEDNLVASSMARGIGMLIPSRDGFELENNGLWDLEYTIVYPSTLDVTASDPDGRVENLEIDGRDAVRIHLPRGATADVSLVGRAHFDAAVFAIQTAELGLVGFGGFLGVRRARAGLRVRRTRTLAQA